MKVHDGRLIGDYNPQKFNNYVSLDRIILLITIFSFVWILAYKLYFLDLEEFFPGASVVGEIIYNIFLSVIGSSVFYYLVVFLPAKRKKKIISRAVSRRIGKLNYDYLFIMEDLYKLKGKQCPQILPDDFNEIVSLCDNILLTDTPPHIHNNPAFYPKNWFEYFEYYFELERQNIDYLDRYWEEIPLEVKVLIDELEANTLRSGLELYKTTGHSNKLSALGGPIWTHLNILRRIVNTFQTEWVK